MDQLLLIVILLLAFAAIFLLARMFFAGAQQQQALEALGVETRPRVARSLLLKLSRPFITRLLPLTRRIAAPDWRRKRSRDILAGGLTDEISVDELWAYKFFLALVALVLLFMFKHDASWWVWPLAALMGFYFPDRWVKDRVGLRQRQIVRALPNVADMLALSVEAGLDFMGAIGKVVAKSKPGPLIEELGVMLGEIRLGASRADGLRNLAYRCNVTSLSAFVAVLIQADRLGVSIGQVLRAQSDKLRTDRFQQAERLGAQATQKILLPLILCIMPAVFIIIIGPLVLKYVLGL
ncbi:MAG: type II secretion system F family protein [Pseudomonadota bacterium]